MRIYGLKFVGLMLAFLVLPGFAVNAKSQTAHFSYSQPSSAASMPTPVNSAMGANASGTIYVAGGNNGSGRIGTLQAYSPATNTWATKAPMPTARYAGAAAAIGGNIYVAGGWGQYVPYNVLEVYNTAADTWSSAASMPHLSACGVAGAIDNQIYVFTACNGYSGYFALLDVYNPVTNAWTSLPSGPNAHGGGAGGVINGKLYVAGGADLNGNNQATLDVFDPVSNSWSTLTPMPVALGNIAGDVINGKLYVVGGYDGSNYVSTVYIYDPVAGSWSDGPLMPTARGNMNAVAASGELYVAGGSNASGNTGALEILNTGTVDFGTVAIGQTSGPVALTFTFDSGGTIGAPTALTQGGAGLDFAALSGGTCAAGAYTTGATCTVNAAFTPGFAGLRNGAVVLEDGSGNTIATAYVHGIGYGPQVSFLPGSQSYLGGSTIVMPTGVAVDGSGNLFVAGDIVGADSFNVPGLFEIPNGCGASNCVKTLLSSTYEPYGVALDSSGNIFASDLVSGAVLEILAPGYSTVKTLYTVPATSQGSFAPYGVAVDGSGNVFATVFSFDCFEGSGQNCGAVDEIVAAGGYTTVNPLAQDYTSANGFIFPRGIAVDGSGNVFIADNYTPAIEEIPVAGGYTTVTPLAGTPLSGWGAPYGVAADGNGNIFVADYDLGVFEIQAASGYSTVNTVANGALQNLWGLPVGVAVDGSGNVYIAVFSINQVEKLDFVDAPSLSFPTSTNVGSADIADGPQTVSVLNIGNQPLTFTAPTSGTNPSYPAAFTENTADTNLCTSTTPLAMGASCDVSANFEPTGAGTNSGSIVLTDNALNAANAMQSILLTGTGIGSQTITFTPPTSPVIYGAATITLMATGGASGNPVTFSIVSGPGSLSGTNNSVLTLTGGGTIVVAANQAGSADYAAATQVTQSIVVEQPAALTSPTPGSAFAGSNVMFTWTAASGATGYVLSLGSTGVGSSNLYYSGSTTAVSVTVSALPTNGETIYARLFTNFNGTWAHVDYTFTAAAEAMLTTPTPGSTLTSSSTTFGWTTVTGATGYILSLGSTGAGSTNLYYSGSTTGASATVTGLPTNGETIYARLLTNLNGTWVHADYTYKAASPTAAVLTTPAPGSTLANSSVKFTWTPATGATGYILQIGSTGVGSYNLYYSGSTTATFVTATDLPTNGETIYARLLTNSGGTWLHNDYTYTAVTQAAMTTPAPGSTLTSSSTTFWWTPVTGATEYLISIGSAGAGSTNLYYSATTNTSDYVTGLPINGETIYVRLFTDNGGTWLHTDYTYTSVTEQQAVLTTPTPGSTLGGSAVTFTWASAPNATGYILALGSSGAGSTNLYYSSSTTGTAVNVTGLPINGEPIYARLFTQLNGTWVHTDYTYTAATEAQAVLTTPTPTSTLTGASVTFTWTSAPNATGYILSLGSTGAGSSNLYYSGSTTATSVTVNKLPTNGETIYARLFTQLNGTWVHTDYTYTAAP